MIKLNEDAKKCINKFKLVTEIINSYNESDPFSLNKHSDWKEDLFIAHAFNRVKGFTNEFLNPLKHLSLFELMMLLDSFED